MTFQPSDVILFFLIALSVYFDLTKKKIPNFLTFPAMLLGFIVYTVSGGLQGFVFSFTGFLVGMLVFIIPFMLGGMGGGDVKLMGAVGALKGVEFILYTTFFTALAGGLIAVIFLIINKRLLRFLLNIFSRIAVPILTALYLRTGLEFLNKAAGFFSSLLEIQDTAGRLAFPYGVAIAIGALLVWSRLGFAIMPVYGIIKF